MTVNTIQIIAQPYHQIYSNCQVSLTVVMMHNFSKQQVWQKFSDCYNTSRPQELGMQPVAYRTFCRLWTEQVGYIVVGKPCSNLCWTCQQNNMMIVKMANMMDRERKRYFYNVQNIKNHSNQNRSIN